MKRKTLVLVGIVMTAILVLSVTATATLMIPAADKAKENAKADKSPAIENADDHRVLTPPGLEKIVFIHYKKGFGKPPWAGPPEGKEKGPKCYGFLSKGAKWKTFPITYVIHPDLEATVPGAVFASAETWDDATSQELFNGYTINSTANWDSETPDGRNEFSFGNYPQSGVIAVAIVWGYFSGPPKTREIVEFDVMFDTDFTWGNATLDSAVMDLQNIATHETGHGVGLDDVYDSACSEVTMYGYSGYGETKKRTLEPSDITGLQELYGA